MQMFINISCPSGLHKVCIFNTIMIQVSRYGIIYRPVFGFLVLLLIPLFQSIYVILPNISVTITLYWPEQVRWTWSTCCKQIPKSNIYILVGDNNTNGNLYKWLPKLLKTSINVHKSIISCVYRSPVLQITWFWLVLIEWLHDFVVAMLQVIS